MNTSYASLLLPREDGLRPDFNLLPGDTLNGSIAFYQRYVGSPHYLLTRTTDGCSSGVITYVSVPNSVINVNLPGAIDTNATVATTADAALNAEVTAGSNYSAYGKISWTDSSTADFTMFFSVTGDGAHGEDDQSVFSFSSPDPVGPTSYPQTTNSSIDCGAGTIDFGMHGVGYKNVSVEVIYEMSNAGDRMIGFINQLLDTPNISRKYTYVVADDIGSPFYVDGSAGQIKIEKVFSTGSKQGSRAKKITYYYEDSSNATKPTHKMEELDIVLSSDLP